jgi:membrane-bound lytic murein transglycosylase D
MPGVRCVMRSSVASAALVSVFCVASGAEAQANDVSGVGPGRGAGERSVLGTGAEEGGGSVPRRAPRSSSSPSRPDATPEDVPPPTHRRGRAPKDPRPTLPDDVPRAEIKDSVRRSIAQGPTAQDLSAEMDDPELQALHAAELVLFPRPVEGLQPGWSWELPQPLPSGPTVSVTGVPLADRLPGPSRRPELSASDAKWLESLTLPNLPVRLDARVVKYLKFYRDSAQGRAIARAWARKSGRYAPALKAELAKQGLPTDLVWLSLIESGHNPTIESPAGAAGLWQFIPESGRMYGLTVDRWVDERLDPQRSTQAAARFLSDLYRRFGSWELAMASYNMGYGGMSRAVRKYNTNDFWELSRHEAGVPWETTLYVPKIVATAIVMNNKKAFGIDGIKPDEPVSFDTIRVAPGTSLSRVAAAAEVALPEIEAMNPHLLASRVPPALDRANAKTWPIRVPLGKGVVASRKLEVASGTDAHVEPYVVRFGDTIATIAKAWRSSEATLQRLNGLDQDEKLTVGTVLLVPRLPPGTTPASVAEEVTVVSTSQFQYVDRQRIFYSVCPNDRLDDIAHAFGVTTAELVTWNAVDPEARLQSGMTLQVFVPSDAALDRVRFTKEQDTKVLVVGTNEFFDYVEGLKGKRRLVVTVAKGDTLRSIGKRYGMSVGWMERVNRRSRRDELVPGETVVVYSALRAASAKSEFGPTLEPLGPIEAPNPEALPQAAK